MTSANGETGGQSQPDRKWGRDIAIILAILVVVVIAVKASGYAPYSYRYRMTVEVEVDGQIRAGSSVIQVRLHKQPQFPSPDVPPVLPRVSGEAVFLDLGQGRNIIALLGSGPGGTEAHFPAYVVPGHFDLSYKDEDLVKYPKLQGRWDLPEVQKRAPPRSTRILPPPTLITFSDINDPKTAREVNPAEFERVFGDGVHFKRVTIEMTRDSVTRGIKDRLPWWNGPGRPAEVAVRAWLAGRTEGPSIGPEDLFITGLKD